MLIEVKWAIGDKVKFIMVTEENIVKECPCCGGSGKVLGVHNGWYECGECEGTGEIITEEKRAVETEHIGIIADIKIYWNRCAEKYEVWYRMQGWKWSQTWIPEKNITMGFILG